METTPAPRTCSACAAIAPAEAAFCSRCGFPLTAGATPTRAAQAKWYHNPWVVLCLVFFVLGPFGLPLVWSSPKFSNRVKFLLTLVTLAYTAWVLVLAVQAVETGFQHFNDLGASFSM